MSDKLEVIDYFGPKIGKTKLSDEETQELYDICVASNQTDNHKLVGFINEENNIYVELRNSKVVKSIVSLVDDYIRNIDNGIYVDILKANDLDSLVNLTDAWYNKQVAMEYNPVHNHLTAADLVCVIYPKVSLDKNATNYIVNKSAYQEQKGQVHFLYGQNPNINGFGKSLLTLEPEDGDILIFPSSLDHYTAPVLGESYRYSISCNFKIHNHIKRLAQK